MSAARTIDLRGLKCPTPIVRLNEEIRALADGDDLLAVANDRAFELDVKAWCRRTQHELVDFTSADGVFTALIRKAG